jgi:hypothetical protein
MAGVATAEPVFSFFGAANAENRKPARRIKKTVRIANFEYERSMINLQLVKETYFNMRFAAGKDRKRTGGRLIRP